MSIKSQNQKKIIKQQIGQKSTVIAVIIACGYLKYLARICVTTHLSYGFFFVGQFYLCGRVCVCVRRSGDGWRRNSDIKCIVPVLHCSLRLLDSQDWANETEAHTKKNAKEKQNFNASKQLDDWKKKWKRKKSEPCPFATWHFNARASVTPAPLKLYKMYTALRTITLYFPSSFVFFFFLNHLLSQRTN